MGVARRDREIWKGVQSSVLREGRASRHQIGCPAGMYRGEFSQETTPLAPDSESSRLKSWSFRRRNSVREPPPWISGTHFPLIQQGVQGLHG